MRMADFSSQQRMRSCLAVPGSDDRKLAKALSSGADQVVVDLEDAVPVSGKDAAREQVSGWLAGADRVTGLVAVRVNAARTPWCHRDIAACVRTWPPRSDVDRTRHRSRGFPPSTPCS